ncbi:MAG: VWA domain-containing protein [Gammaproteobacteria bacterium]|nr:VWA domain-containing protein [Gammaproteobacteria bacterium]
MNDWLPVALHTPAWLLLLPLPWLLFRRRGSATAGAGSYPGFADPHLLKWLIVGSADTRGARGIRLAWLLIVIAASGPYLPRMDDTPRHSGADIAVVLDISPSMAANDVEPTRLKRAVLELRDLLRRMDDDRVALVVYSAYAYRILPLTRDLDLIDYYADTLSPDLTRRHGSNLAQALEYAGQALGDERERAVVVLSDGETEDSAGALAAAERLKGRGIPVFALGIGSPAGAPVPGAGGFLRTADGIVISRPDRTLLAELARRSGGAYADASAGDEDWDRLSGGLDGLRRGVAASGPTRTGYALHPWLLAAAFTLLVWNGVRRHTVTALPLCLVIAAGASLLPAAGHAAPWREQAAYDALQSGDNAAAAMRYGELDSFTGWLGRGAAYYRQQRWEQARAAFTAAAARAGDADERASALYNLGTTLARLGRNAEAERALEQSLLLRPNHARAQLNLNLVRRAAIPPAMAEAAPERHDDAPAGVVGAPQATDWNAAAGGARPETSPARKTPAQDAGTAQEIGELAARLDRPDEILRHRFMAQDAAHPLSAERQSW